jgi:hypothetical protein
VTIPGIFSGAVRVNRRKKNEEWDAFVLTVG